MKKSIITKITIFIAIIFLVVICTTLYLSKSRESNNNKINNIVTAPSAINNNSGTRDYEYYYNYENDYGCNYYDRDNSIYHIEYGGDWGPPVFCEMPAADKKTFKVLDFLYTKDKNLVFYSCKIIKDADAPTFEAIYSKEASGCNKESNFATGFAKDKKYIYRYGKIIPSLDVSSFKLISSGCIIYLKDKNGIYDFSGKTINEADPETFIILKDIEPPNCDVNSYDSEDKNHHYKSGKIVN